MATTRERIGAPEVQTPGSALAVGPAPVCGECVYHIPHVTKTGGWCACKAAESKWMQASERHPACDAFASWPEGSPVTRFLAAMRC